MPISNWNQIPAIMNEVYRLQPKTVLDLGIGFGKYGPLLREVLDGMYGRCARHLWQSQLIGFEAHGAYENPAWDCYSAVYEFDFADSKNLCHTGKDLVLMIDSLEHLEPERGAAFLEELIQRNKHVIISVPVVHMPQEAVYGNEFERHRTHYSLNSFDQYNPEILFKGETAVFSIKGKL